MIELNYKDNVYAAPSTWSEVTVRQMSSIMRIMSNKELSNMDLNIKLISELFGIGESFVEKIAYNKFIEILSEFKFLTDKVDNEYKDTIVIDGCEYGFKDNFNSLTLGETISIEMIMEKGIYENLTAFFCILLRKKLEDGSLEEYDTSFQMSRKNMIEDLPITKLFTLINFTPSTDKK